jgi:hypothetical protein
MNSYIRDSSEVQLNLQRHRLKNKGKSRCDMWGQPLMVTLMSNDTYSPDEFQFHLHRHGSELSIKN